MAKTMKLPKLPKGCTRIVLLIGAASEPGLLKTLRDHYKKTIVEQKADQQIFVRRPTLYVCDEETASDFEYLKLLQKKHEESETEMYLLQLGSDTLEQRA